MANRTSRKAHHGSMSYAPKPPGFTELKAVVLATATLVVAILFYLAGL